MLVRLSFSINSEIDGALSKALRTILEGYGFVKARSNTATYKAPRISKVKLSRALRDFWRRVATHAGPGAIDNFFCYVEA